MESIAQQKPDDAEAIRLHEERTLQEIVETVLLQKPELKDRLTLAAARQLMYLPASSLGWTSDGGMPPEVRKLSVIMHLRLGAVPGFKHLLWLGNGFYPTAAFWNMRINQDLEKSKVTAPMYRLCTPEEKAGMGLLDGDIAWFVEQTFNINGRELHWTGHGIIGTDELDKRGSNGKPLPGFQSRKDRIQTAKTRAARDMYSRNYPIEGVTTTAEDVMESPDFAPGPSLEAAPQTIDLKAEEIKDRWMEAVKQLNAAKAAVIAQGGDPDKIAGTSIEYFLASVPYGHNHAVNDMTEILQDWVASATTEKPTEKPVKTPKPAAKAPELPPDPDTDPEPPKPKRAGRKSNAEREALAAQGLRYNPQTRKVEPIPTAEQALAAVEDAAKAVIADPVKFDEALQITEAKAAGIVVSEVEELIGDEPATPDDLSFLDESNYNPDTEEFSYDVEDVLNVEPEIYTGTESQKEIIRKFAQDAGIVENGILHALAGAMRNRPMTELPAKIEAMKTIHSAKAIQPPPAAKPDVKPLQAARERLKNAIDLVTSTGGAPMHILGVNPHNVLAGGTVDAMIQAAAKLEEWQPQPAEKAVVSGFPEVPTSGPGADAYKMLGDAFRNTGVNEKVKPLIADMAKRVLKDGDGALLAKAIRLANGGDFKELQSFLNVRQLRK